MAERELSFSPRAREDLDSLSPDVARRISTRILGLILDSRPRRDTIKRMSGFEFPLYRLRIGDYRAFFRVEPAVVRIMRVVHRSRLDRELEDLR